LDIPKIIAHRGASFDAPENTLAAFRMAWEQGADGIEGDFHLTRDQRIVCLHDKTTKRTGRIDLTVARTSLNDLKQLDVGGWKDPRWAGERIPTLEEVLETVPARGTIYIEIKCGQEIIHPLESVLRRSGLRSNQVVMISFNQSVLQEARSKLFGFKCFWLTGFKQTKSSGRWSPSDSEVIRILRELGLSGVGCNALPAVNDFFASTLRNAAKELHVWTVNDIPTAVRFARLGVVSITTDRPAWLRRQLELQLGDRP